MANENVNITIHSASRVRVTVHTSERTTWCELGPVTFFMDLEDMMKMGEKLSRAAGKALAAQRAEEIASVNP